MYRKTNQNNPSWKNNTKFTCSLLLALFSHFRHSYLPHVVHKLNRKMPQCKIHNIILFNMTMKQFWKITEKEKKKNRIMPFKLFQAALRVIFTANCTDRVNIIQASTERNQTPHPDGNLDDVKCNYCMHSTIVSSVVAWWHINTFYICLL